MMKQCHKCFCYDEEFDYFRGSSYGDCVRISEMGKDEEDVHYCTFFGDEPIDNRIVNDEIECDEFFSIEEFEKIANHLNDKEPDTNGKGNMERSKNEFIQ